MDSEQSYVFDVNGFIVVRSVLTVSASPPTAQPTPQKGWGQGWGMGDGGFPA